jgi:hypothetical protein
VGKVLRNALICVGAFTLVACAGDSPGPLEGTWTAAEPMPITVSFRSGEVEAMGATRKASYRVSGNDVLVTYLEGANKGTTFRYTVIDADTIRSESGTFRRVR